MSRLDELIAKLCPDGVEHKTIGELFNTRNGYTPSKNNPEFWTEGTIPWFRMEDIREKGPILSEAIQYVNEKAVKGMPFPADSIIVATSATIGQHALLKVASLANQRFTYLMLKDEWREKFDIKFLFYYCYKLDEFCLNHLNQGNFASVDMKQFISFRFPVPSLEVQREIVRILDNFTDLTSELTSKLNEELAARKKQYEYYRNNLLSFDDSIRKMPLSDVANVFRGEYITQKGSKAGAIPVILGGQEPAYYIDKSNHEGEIVVIARSGVSAGYVSYWNEPIFVTDGFGYEAKQGVVIPKYLYYVLKRKEPELNAMKRGAGVPHISGEMLSKVGLSIPSIPIQERLVNVLDNFESICNDLNIGLPAEIEKRQKQHEYYRDLLLTFAETGCTLEQEAGSRKQEAGSRKQEAGSRKQETDKLK